MYCLLRGLVSLLLFLVVGAQTRGQDLYAEGVVRTLELRFAPANWAQLLAQNYQARTFLRADLVVDGLTYTDVGVRYRGNTSYTQIGTSPKKPFEISLDEYAPGRRLYGYKTLNLNNGFRDPTFVREVLCFWIFRQFMPAPKANFVRLVINSESFGPYINVQQVNKELQEEWFRDGDGSRYRAERQPSAGTDDSALIWLGADPTRYTGGYELKTDPTPDSFGEIMHLCDVVNNTALARLPSDLPKVLDDDLALRYLAANSVMPAVDSYIGNVAHNYYLVFDAFHARFALVPWDLNASFGGNNWLTVQQKVQLDPYYTPSGRARPLLTRMLQVPTYKARYLAHIRAVLDLAYDWNSLGPRVAQLQRLVETDLIADTKKLYTMQLFRDNVVRDVQIQVGVSLQWIPGMQSMVTGRSAFLRAHTDVARMAPTVDGLLRAPQAPTVRDTVAVTARVSGVSAAAVSLFARERGRWLDAPMFDDGAHGDGAANDGVWGAFLAPRPFGTVVEYYVGAEATDGSIAFAPRTAGHRPPSYRIGWPTRPSSVQLNELLASNSTGIRDERGEREDWFELVNAGAHAEVVAGMYLTDDIARPTRWRIPAGQVLAPGATVLVWADDEPLDGPLHATFKLAAEGEELALFDTDGVTLLDWLRFGPQRRDESAGRLADGTGPWVTFPTAQTPNAPNAPPLCGRRAYSTLEPATHTMLLDAIGTSRIGSQDTWLVRNGPASSVAFALLAGSGASMPIPGHSVSLLIGNPLLVVLTVPTDGQGAASVGFAFPNNPALVGAHLFVAALAPAASGLVASNALETVVCPR